MVIYELINEISSILGENAEYEAKELIMYALEMSLTELTLNRNMEVSDGLKEKIEQLLKRRLNGEPLQYITGIAGFMGLEFEVNPYTLIPRQDTETLVETLLERVSEGAKIIDIGTGSGCIGISLAKYIKNAEVTLADISEKALETASRNAHKNGVVVKLLNIDILKELPKGKFDMIVSNPPYIESEIVKDLDKTVRDFEPVSALDGGTDGLDFYRRITEIAPQMLNNGGILAYEIGYNQGEAVTKIVKSFFGNVELIKDYCGNDRVVIAVNKENYV